MLGYSTGRGSGLHPVCAARLERAAREATAGDTVLLTGWSRRRRRASEAELMAEAWSGEAHALELDSGARTTKGNARAIAAAARRLEATEVVVVTSGWHGPRAAALARRALEPGTPVRLATTDERGSLRARLRELACRPLVPLG